MLSITSYTKVGLRIATISGAIFATLSLAIGFVYFILKLMYWNSFPAGNIPTLLAVIILGSAQIFFIGFLGEYILSINSRIMKRPLVIEEERLNFDEDDEEEEEKPKKKKAAKKTGTSEEVSETSEDKADEAEDKNEEE